MGLARWLFPLVRRAPLSLIATLVLIRFADEWFSFFPAGALEPIRADFNLSYAEAGLILAALPAGGLLGHGFTVAADFVDRRLLGSAGALVFGLAMLGFAFGQSFAALLVASFVWGAASDAFIHGCEVALVDLYRDELAAALGRVNAYGAVGDLLGPLTLAAATAVGVSWRVVFAGGGLLMLLYAIWIAWQAFPRPMSPVKETSPFAAVLAVARDRRIILLGVVDGLFGLLDEPFLGFTIAYLEQVRGVSPTLSTAIIAVAVAAGFIGFLAVQLFTARFAPRTLLLAFGTILAVAVTALVVAPVVLLQVVAAFAFGFAGATFYSVLQAAYLGLRPGQAGTTEAVVATIGLFGIGFPALVGAVSDVAGLAAGLGLYAAIPLVVLLLLVLGAAPTRPAS